MMPVVPAAMVVVGSLCMMLALIPGLVSGRCPVVARHERVV